MLFCISCSIDKSQKFNDSVYFQSSYEQVCSFDSSKYELGIEINVALSKFYLYSIYDYEKAEKLFILLIEELEKKQYKSKVLLTQCYIDYSHLLIKKRDFDLAYAYSKLGYLLAQKNSTKLTIGNAAIAHAICLFNIRRYKESIKYLKSAKNYISTEEPLAFQEILIYETLNYINQGDSNSVRSIMVKIDNYEKSDDNFLAEVYRLKCIQNYRSGDFIKSIVNGKRSITIHRSKDCFDLYTLGNCYALVSAGYLQLGILDSALMYQDSALQVKNINEDSFQAYLNNPHLITEISDLAEIEFKRYALLMDTFHVRQVFNIYQSIEKLMKSNSTLSKDSYLENKRYNNYFYSNVISLCEFMFQETKDGLWLKNLHNYLNKYKASSLTFDRQYIQLLDKVKLKNRNLYKRIVKNSSNLEEIILKESISTSHDSVPHYQSMIKFFLEEKELQNELKYKFPNLYKFATSIVEIDYKKLDVDSTKLFIWYYLGSEYYNPNKILCLTRTNGLYKLFHFKRSNSLKKEIELLHQLNSNFVEKIPEIELYAKTSFSVYTAILGPILDSFPNATDLVITPDAEIVNVSFSGLIKSEFDISIKRYADLEYLIDSTDITYSFATRGNQTDFDDKFEKHEILFINWSDRETIIKGNSPFSELPSSYLLAEQLIEKYGDSGIEHISGSSSTVDNLYRHANDKEVVHLGLHGKSNNASRLGSHLIFRDQDKSHKVLYPYEIIIQSIKPKLVILSACESGAGKFLRDEGMFSISRAFYISGAQEVISSTWVLEDKTSAQILRYFYHDYFTNRNTSTSFNSAIRKYLNNDFAFDKYCFPGYWAGMILYN